MSWSGFKKATGRATTQLMMKTGHVEKTSDREYEVEERRYRTLESASLRLQKEAKGYLDSLRAMTASQMRIAETIDAFYGESGAKDGVSRSYKQAVEDLDAETVKALDGPYRLVPADLHNYLYDDETGLLDEETMHEIEEEMNFSTKRRVYTRGPDFGLTEVDVQGASKLMDFVYRTTVLEPINRFCAYFPDINECIKKRNHKLLDYDAMRSKVKKLVEKPDKDPAKLPRTEKETEMVSMLDFLEESEQDPSLLETDFSVPSPPKALDRIKRLQQEEEDIVRRHSGFGLNRSPSIMSRVSSFRRSSRAGPGYPDAATLQRSSSGVAQSTRTRTPSMSLTRQKRRESSTDALLQKSPPLGLRTESNVNMSPRSKHSSGSGHGKRLSSSPSITSTINSLQSKGLLRNRTPFFHPSELEQLMQPLREEYTRTQTNELAQAKAAYDQLNEQLTNELPQLIDLRVPYLDPSFEALVKIQLRFCAEAYSRMAQVQQYLDASTRDQYASGDLDARVEDVLGQIRELSIAGTV